MRSRFPSRNQNLRMSANFCLYDPVKVSSENWNGIIEFTSEAAKHTVWRRFESNGHPGENMKPAGKRRVYKKLAKNMLFGAEVLSGHIIFQSKTQSISNATRITEGTQNLISISSRTPSPRLVHTIVRSKAISATRANAVRTTGRPLHGGHGGEMFFSVHIARYVQRK